MKKLILILALGLVLAACAGEPQVVVVTATLVPPTVTPSPPTATPIPPTITPVPWDAEVSGFTASLYQLPNSEAPIMKTLARGRKVDLLAVTEDKEWVQATADLGDWKGTGWLQVDKLELNVSLDDLAVDTETVFVQSTSIPVPPLGERYLAHFVEKGFEPYNDRGMYSKEEGRLTLLVADLELGQVVAYIVPNSMSTEEIDMLREHVIEASEFLDPGFGWETIQVAIDGMDVAPTGTAWHGGREVEYELVDDGETTIASYLFMNVATFIGTDNAEADAAPAALTHDYRLDGSFTDDLGGPALVPAGGTLNPTNYSFGPNQGLSLSNGLIDSANYSIEMIFNLSGESKFLDFKDLGSDNGIYNFIGKLEFYPGPIGPPGAIPADTDVHLVVTRDSSSNRFVGYVDGVWQISFTDSSGDAIFSAASNIIQFFKDDVVFADPASAGIVNRIRIYDGVLTPSEVAALSAE